MCGISGVWDFNKKQRSDDMRMIHKKDNGYNIRIGEKKRMMEIGKKNKHYKRYGELTESETREAEKIRRVSRMSQDDKENATYEFINQKLNNVIIQWWNK